MKTIIRSLKLIYSASGVVIFTVLFVFAGMALVALNPVSVEDYTAYMRNYNRQSSQVAGVNVSQDQLTNGRFVNDEIRDDNSDRNGVDSPVDPDDQTDQKKLEQINPISSFISFDVSALGYTGVQYSARANATQYVIEITMPAGVTDLEFIKLTEMNKSPKGILVKTEQLGDSLYQHALLPSSGILSLQTDDESMNLDQTKHIYEFNFTNGRKETRLNLLRDANGLNREELLANQTRFRITFSLVE